jgi:hypothetical protein
MTKYRKGDIFVHRNKGSIAVITQVSQQGDYSFKSSNPSEKKASWDTYVHQSEESITKSLDAGYMVLYRPVASFLEDNLFEVD